LTNKTFYDNPIGRLQINKKIVSELKAAIPFCFLSNDNIEKGEHSVEMQLPFISYIMADTECKIIPILIGSAPYDLQDSSNFFVISSDFCHWGSKFNFTPFQRSDISRGIRNLDTMEMKSIESSEVNKYIEYQEKNK